MVGARAVSAQSRSVALISNSFIWFFFIRNPPLCLNLILIIHHAALVVKIYFYKKVAFFAVFFNPAGSIFYDRLLLF